MGNQQVVSGESWETVSRTDQYVIKRNAQNFQVEEYSEVVPSKKDLAIHQQFLDSRKAKLNSDDSRVVKLYSHKAVEVPTACSSSYNLVTHTERIPSRLTSFKDNSEAKSIYVLNEMLEGYKSISKEYGNAFNISPDMVGFNSNYQVKVWFHSNFSKCQPETELLGTKYSKTDHEHRLITRIFQLVEATNEEGVFSPNFKNAKGLHLTKPYKFETTIDFIRNYAAENHPDIFQDQVELPPSLLEVNVAQDGRVPDKAIQHYPHSTSTLTTLKQPAWSKTDGASQPVKTYQYQSLLQKEGLTIQQRPPIYQQKQAVPQFAPPVAPSAPQPALTQPVIYSQPIKQAMAHSQTSQPDQLQTQLIQKMQFQETKPQVQSQVLSPPTIVQPKKKYFIQYFGLPPPVEVYQSTNHETSHHVPTSYSSSFALNAYQPRTQTSHSLSSFTSEPNFAPAPPTQIWQVYPSTTQPLVSSPTFSIQPSLQRTNSTNSYSQSPPTLSSHFATPPTPKTQPSYPTQVPYQQTQPSYPTQIASPPTQPSYPIQIAYQHTQPTYPTQITYQQIQPTFNYLQYQSQTPQPTQLRGQPALFQNAQIYSQTPQSSASVLFSGVSPSSKYNQSLLSYSQDTDSAGPQIQIPKLALRTSQPESDTRPVARPTLLRRLSQQSLGNARQT